jgi:hypothetical protein
MEPRRGFAGVALFEGIHASGDAREFAVVPVRRLFAGEAKKIKEYSVVWTEAALSDDLDIQRGSQTQGANRFMNGIRARLRNDISRSRTQNPRLNPFLHRQA